MITDLWIGNQGHGDTECPSCGSMAIMYNQVFGFYKCEHCSNLWAYDEDDPDYDELQDNDEQFLEDDNELFRIVAFILKSVKSEESAPWDFTPDELA